jgi:hypothetical protein
MGCQQDVAICDPLVISYQLLSIVINGLPLSQASEEFAFGRQADPHEAFMMLTAGWLAGCVKVPQSLLNGDGHHEAS